METTSLETTLAQAQERNREERRRIDELATLSAHLSAATARMLELVWTMHKAGDVDGGELAGFLAFRCGVTGREAREYLRVAEALAELPAIRAAFSGGELTFTKVRALTRVATPDCEERLLELAGALTASQLERALRVYRRVADAEARRTHELEYVDYHFEEDGSLYLRARLAAEDGVILVKALDAARQRVFERRRQQRAAAEREADAREDDAFYTDAPERPVRVEAFAELAEAALAASDEHGLERARLVVHVDAAALAADDDDDGGRAELEDGPGISAETVRRLGCDADVVAQVERDGLPVSVGRTRRTVPPALRRLLEARDDETCCFPGCERTRHLQAHHRRHWAHGGETSLDNLVLLCFQHHRLVHEGGYTIEDDPRDGVRFRNRHGVLTAHLPPRPPPGWAGELLAEHDRLGLEIGPRTNQNGGYYPFDLGAAVSAVSSAFG
jgi:hypothetical protein